jgi:hypothetical protein
MFEVSIRVAYNDEALLSGVALAAMLMNKDYHMS